MRQGQVWQISDEAVEFAQNRGRIPHETDRGCVIIEGNESLARGSPTVLIVPTSSQTHLKDTYDVLVPHPPAPNQDCVALVEHPMTVLRSDLTFLVQPIGDEYLRQILFGLVAKLGIKVG
jgi:mRNA-degrading endonuclease toxin of MazEF toxin-antitoxin module